MSRVLDIVTRARDTLADYTPKKWKNDRLLRVLSEAQKKIARETFSLRYSGTIQLCSGYHTYKLDSALIEPLGGYPLALFRIVNHDGKDCTFVSAQKMATINVDWRTETGNDITHIIYDHKKPLEFRVYPTPLTADITETGASFNTTDEPFADAATISEAITTESNFDITLELAPVKMQVEFYHTPPDITTIIDTNLLISEHFDLALKHYVTGMLLRDDKDTQNRSFGIEELKLFNEQFMIAKALSEADFTDVRTQHYAEVAYEDVTVR